jgi:tRNA dimethylallyltransferase
LQKPWKNAACLAFAAYGTMDAEMAASNDLGRRTLVIIGATATGKSALAMSVAQLCGAEILNIDSMQLYRGMDIGTAKPSAAERNLVPHHGLDLADPNDIYTVARFAAVADGVIEQTHRRGVPLIVVGGAPLYFKAIFEGLFSGPAADDTIRARLMEQDAAALHTQLSKIDPVSAGRLHPQDRRRVMRALEVYELTGTPISSLQTEWASAQARHAAVWIGLHWDRDALNRRINLRVKEMIAAGWLEETRQLLHRYGTLSGTAGEATGYHELAEHLAGRMSLEDAIEQIKIATRQLARRQMKWFRRFPNVLWLSGDRPIEENTAAAIAHWQNHS